MERDDIFAEAPSDRSSLALDQGTILNNKFRIGRVLGIGGFAVTYLAFDEVLEMGVAVKEYLPNDIAARETGSGAVQPFSSSGEERGFEYGLERFLREARMLAKFERHPNIVRVRTFFEENGTAYLVMNFYQGRTLAEYLEARNGFLPEEEALLIMDQVLEGLRAVHEENVLHRDIAPNNVYLADDGTVVLLDFGAARTAVGEQTRSMSVVLKRGYAPHEQYHSRGNQGPWTDIYACAATFYRSLTGYKPPEAAARILNDDLAPPKELVPPLSDATNDALLKGLAVRPQDRPQSVDEFATLLPDVPANAEAGWVGTPLSRNVPSPDTTSTVELQVTTTHACRLYVDGSLARELPAAGNYSLTVTDGVHRLRAVRSDRAAGGNATVTAAGTDPGDDGGTRVPLDALMWRDVITASTETSKTVDIAFTDADTTTLNTQSAVQTVAPDMPTETTAAAAAVPDGPIEDEDTGVVHEDSHETQLPSKGDADPEATPDTRQGVEFFAALEPPATVNLDMIPSETALRYGGTGIGALLILLLIGWWALSNDAPIAAPDRAFTITEPVIVDVVANDRDPNRDALHIRSAGPVPDSVAQVETVDSTRLRIRPASGFSGTANVPYVLADASGDTARSHVTFGVPFDGTKRVVTSEVGRPQDVHPVPLEGKGPDVAVAALGVRSVGWVPHSPSTVGDFSPFVALTASRDGAVDVHTADLTGNGRPDLLSTTLQGDVVRWYENQPDGTYASPRLVTTDVNGPVAVQTADIDGDGDADVIVGTRLGERLLWYENQGNGQFGNGRVIDRGLRGLTALHVDDLDNDDTPDVLAVSYRDSVITRYEPRSTTGSVRFETGPSFSLSQGGPIEVHTADVTGNGWADVLVGLSGAPSVVLMENQADTTNTLSFKDGRSLNTDVETVEAIGTGDVEGDGAPDVFAGSFDSNSVVWFENDGGGIFRPAQPVATGVPNVLSLAVTDMNNDGTPDVLTASQSDNLVAWYENHLR